MGWHCRVRLTTVYQATGTLVLTSVLPSLARAPICSGKRLTASRLAHHSKAVANYTTRGFIGSFRLESWVALQRVLSPSCFQAVIPTMKIR
jgi:hypothetical protein